MGWSTPATWVAGTVVTASDLNTYIRDNQRYLKGIGQVPTIESGLTIDNTDGDERLLLPLLSTAECSTVLNAEGEVAFDEQTHQMKAFDGTAVRAVISEADVDDTPVNGATTVPVSSNWAYDFINTLTTQADLPYATAAGTWDRLAKGTASQILRMNSGATAPEWSTGGASIATGSYTGNDAGDRQITVGFKCSMVIFRNFTDQLEVDTWVLIPNASWSFAGTEATANIALHATDGFTVNIGSASPNYGNESGETYYYWAISE